MSAQQVEMCWAGSMISIKRKAMVKKKKVLSEPASVHDDSVQVHLARITR